MDHISQLWSGICRVCIHIQSEPEIWGNNLQLGKKHVKWFSGRSITVVQWEVEKKTRGGVRDQQKGLGKLMEKRNRRGRGARKAAKWLILQDPSGGPGGTRSRSGHESIWWAGSSLSPVYLFPCLVTWPPSAWMHEIHGEAPTTAVTGRSEWGSIQGEECQGS